MSIYTIVVSYSGFDSKFDDKIKKIAQRNIGGSGYSMIDGKRDLSFIFKTEESFNLNRKKFKVLEITDKDKDVQVNTFETVGPDVT